MLKDIVGQPINQGDRVALPLGFGMLGVGDVVHISSGLVTIENQNQPTLPTVQVAVLITLQVQPNGVVSGVTRVGGPNPA